MSSVTENTFDALQALRILVNLADMPDPDTSCQRGLVAADVKR